MLVGDLSWVGVDIGVGIGVVIGLGWFATRFAICANVMGKSAFPPLFLEIGEVIHY